MFGAQFSANKEGKPARTFHQIFPKTEPSLNGTLPSGRPPRQNHLFASKASLDLSLSPFCTRKTQFDHNFPPHRRLQRKATTLSVHEGWVRAKVDHNNATGPQNKCLPFCIPVVPFSPCLCCCGSSIFTRSNLKTSCRPTRSPYTPPPIRDVDDDDERPYPT